MALNKPTWKEWLVIAFCAVCLACQWYALAHAPPRGRAPAAAKP